MTTEDQKDAELVRRFRKRPLEVQAIRVSEICDSVGKSLRYPSPAEHQQLLNERAADLETVEAWKAKAEQAERRAIEAEGRSANSLAAAEQANFDEMRVEQANTDLRRRLAEAIDAGKTLALHTQGRSENREVAEAKEQLERATLADSDPPEEPYLSQIRCTVCDREAAAPGEAGHICGFVQPGRIETCRGVLIAHPAAQDTPKEETK